MLTKTDVIEAVAQYPRLDEIGNEPYEPHGIFNSEMAAIIGVTLAMNVDVFIESGRARGHSTLLLAKHLGAAGIAVHSFDRDRNADTIYSEAKLAGMPNLTLHYGDSRVVIPDFAARESAKRVAILVDGPKNKKAIDLLSDCIVRSDNVVTGFVHDVARLKSDEAQQGRILAERYFEKPFFTDDADFVERFRHLDEPVFAATDAGRAHWKPYLNDGVEQISYGPTLGIFFPTDNDRDAARRRGLRATAPRRLYWSLRQSLRRAMAQ